MSDSAPTGDARPLLGEVGKNWGWLLALGIAFVVLGALGLGLAGFVSLTSVIFFGALLLVGGGAQLVHAVKAKGWKSIVHSVAIAALYLAAGACIVYDPVAATATLTLLLAGALIAIGVLRIGMAFQLRGQPQWIWPLLAGIVSILLGAMILSAWPASGIWIIGLLISIEMIFHGWALVSMAFAARGAAAEGDAAGGASHG